MPREITITTGARLHFGIFSYEPITGRHFGGAGLMIEPPGFQIVVKPSEKDSVSGPEDCVKRCRSFLKTYRSNRPPDKQPPPCHFEILNAIPSHQGLGSGTQLGMAVAKSLSLMAGEKTVDTVSLAGQVGRGARSALGVHGFQRGGFLLDGGKDATNSIGHLEAREEFPAEWRLLLVTPQNGPDGLFGGDEYEAFSRMPPMSQDITQRLRRIATEEMLPAVRNTDFDRFSRTVYEFGNTVGKYFAPVQGGDYASRQTADLVEFLRKQGVQGVGQSSWGPTSFVLLRNQQAADQLFDDLSDDSRWSDCHLLGSRPWNSPARIEIK